MKYNKNHKKEWLGLIRSIDKQEQAINKHKYILIEMGKAQGIVTDEDLLAIIKPIGAKCFVQGNSTPE